MRAGGRTRRMLNVLASAFALGIAGWVIGETSPLYGATKWDHPFELIHDELGFTHAIGGAILGILIGLLANRRQKKMPAEPAPPQSMLPLP